MTKIKYTLPSREASSSRCNRHQLLKLHLRNSGVSAVPQHASTWWQTFVAHVTTVLLVTQRTVTADWRVEHCLPQVLHAVAPRRPRTLHRAILLHHHNAPAHKAKRTRDFLAQERFQQLRDPAYSPELAACDFFIFPEVKKKLRGVCFQSAEAAVNAYREHLESMPASVV